MKKSISAALLFLCLQASAQQAKPTFQTTVQLGLLEGQRGGAFQLQAINGFQVKTWFAGAGAGLDYYHTRSIPVFLHLRKAFFREDKTPFVYVSGGYHFPWMKEVEEPWFETKARGGRYVDAGIGYQVPVMKKSALFFSAGYSQKNFSLEQSEPVWIAIWPAPGPPKRVFDYSLRRLSIQTGFRF